ncbi:unnamed protein product [Dicrocoelium dendriticum]|nr:unnamed protein product [Dicrocoelium dendriticum]
MTSWSLHVVVRLLCLCYPVRNFEFPFKNHSLPIHQRLDDLLSRLTVDELIVQVSKGGAGPQHGPAPGIKRLGIDPFQWRTNPGDGEGTSFPLPINQAATFDSELVHRIAFATGLEMRAKWNQHKRAGQYEDGTGIHVYAPVTNLMRHPLWGRNQETYGEDPYLSGQLSEAYVKGVGGWRQIKPQLSEDRNNPLTAHTLLFVQSDRHRKLAVVAVASSIVLVHHRPGIFPLQPVYGKVHKPPLKRIAVIGPFATKVDELYGGYHNIRIPEFEVPVQKGMEQVAEAVDADEICFDGALCQRIDVPALISILHRDQLSMVVLTVGTGNRVEAEGQDRENISLPGKQSDLLQKTLELTDSIYDVNPLTPIPVVILVFSTGPVDIHLAVSHPRVVAIFWCGFPGAHIGEALARIMLGNPGDPYGVQAPLMPDADEDKELGSWGLSTPVAKFWWIPAARLPFTWYRSISHLPDMTYYEMTNQTYRYLPYECSRASDDCKLPILFPFGYGLTYNADKCGASEFVYSQLILPANPILIGQPFVIYATVTNAGPLASDEVVQCYVSWMRPNTSLDVREEDIRSPNIQLAGFRRIGLKVGERKTMEFTLSAEALSVWSESANGTVPGEGRLRVTVGGQQPDQDVSVGSNIISGYVEILRQI